ncbi:hypothetical protein WH91_07595 [Devosia psychrophila]|nr:hypothetical protein WH91_07595 [Devosia psychrophila]
MVRNIVLGVVAALSFALPAVAAERAIIVLDGSGSMWAQIDGKARITLARETLHKVLATLPDDLELGLMAYGHREKGNCADIEMLIEPAVGTGAAIAAAADAINPTGMTPISDAVRLAAENLQYTERKATVILITDGLETCEVDPCALAADLESKGIDFTTHVLGFGLSDEEGQQVACLAENTGGQYLSAEDGDALVRALTTTVAQVTQAAPAPVVESEPEPVPVLEYNYKPTASLSEGGPDIVDDKADLVWTWYKVAADGGEGEYVGTDYYSTFEGSLPPGDYYMTATLDYANSSQVVTIEEGKAAAPHFVINGTVLKLHPMASEGGEVVDEASTEVSLAGEYVTTSYGDFDVVVPAGMLEVTVAIGEASVSRTYQAEAGATIDEDVIVGSATAHVVSEYVAGTPVAGDISIEIVGAGVALDGTREGVATSYGGDLTFDLGEGDYVAIYDLGGATGEVPFSVKSGTSVEVPIVLDAGVLLVTTPGDNYVEIFSVTKNIEGNRKSFDYGYGPDFQTTLAAGDYIVATRFGDAVTETPVNIKAGERFELTVEAAPAALAGGKKK